MDTGPQVAFALIGLAEDFQRRGQAPVHSAAFAVWFLDDIGDGAGPVEVEIRIQILPMELAHGLGFGTCDMRESQVFAYHRSVLVSTRPLSPKRAEGLQRVQPLLAFSMASGICFSLKKYPEPVEWMGF